MSRYGNVPFDLPAGWVWTTIGELVCNRDEERIPVSSAIRKKQANKIYDYYGAAGVIDKVDSYLFDERLLLVGEDGANLISRAKDNAFFAEGKYWVNNHAHILDCTDKEILDFVAFVINAIDLSQYISGSAQPKLNQENLNKIFIPLPPKREQKRIISSVSDLTNVVQGISDSVKVMNCLIDKIRSKILDLAISGKLVPQDPTDEPAIELLKRINPAFKPCDNPHYPFELPTGWTLSTFGTLNEHKSRSVNPIFEPNKKYELYSVPVFETRKPEFVRGADIGSTKQSVSKGEILICKINPHLNRVWQVEHYDHELSCIASSEWIVFSSSALIPEFAVLYFQSPLFRNLLLSNVSGVGGSLMRARPSAVDGYTVPIPPIMEQERIVKVVSTLEEKINYLT